MPGTTQAQKKGPLSEPLWGTGENEACRAWQLLFSAALCPTGAPRTRAKPKRFQAAQGHLNEAAAGFS